MTNRYTTIILANSLARVVDTVTQELVRTTSGNVYEAPIENAQWTADNLNRAEDRKRVAENLDGGDFDPAESSEKTGANYTFHDADQVEHLLTGERGTVEGEGNDGFTIRWGMRPPFSRAFYQYGSQGAAKIRLVADGATFDPFAAAQEERQEHERAAESHAPKGLESRLEPTETVLGRLEPLNPAPPMAYRLGLAQGAMEVAISRLNGIITELAITHQQTSSDYVAMRLSAQLDSLKSLRDYLRLNADN